MTYKIEIKLTDVQNVPRDFYQHDSSVHVIRSDKQAIETTQPLAADFAKEASKCDHERRLPLWEYISILHLAYGVLPYRKLLMV